MTVTATIFANYSTPDYTCVYATLHAIDITCTGELEFVQVN